MTENIFAAETSHNNEVIVYLIRIILTQISVCDIDWHCFITAKITYKDNEKYLQASENRPLSVSLDKAGFTKERRDHIWHCCMYNFARQIAYDSTDVPGKEINEYWTERQTLSNYTIPDDQNMLSQMPDLR